MTSTPSFKFADDNDKTAYREEVRDLTVWCKDSNLSLNVIKTKEMIVDYKKRRTENTSILNDGAVVDRLRTWVKHTKTVVRRARQNLFPLSRVLQLHHRDYPDWLHHCLVWKLLCL